MARSFSNVKLISAAATAAAVADGLSLSIFRRGFAAAPQGVLYAREGSRVGMMGKVDPKVTMKPDSGASSSWAPDPVTGYYRPENCAAEIDPVELREMLLNQKGRPQ